MFFSGKPKIRCHDELRGNGIEKFGKTGEVGAVTAFNEDVASEGFGVKVLKKPFLGDKATIGHE